MISFGSAYVQGQTLDQVETMLSPDWQNYHKERINNPQYSSCERICYKRLS